MANDESTTKFKVDISQLKKEFQEAQRYIKLVTSEFKASTAGMDNWASNADGLGAKIKQLNSILTAEESKLKSLQNQYALVAKEQGENSKGAQELMIKINNQKAAVEKVRSSIGYYSDKLNELGSESKEAESAVDKLRNTISQQESDLESLKAKYSSLILEQGKGSKAARDTAKEIKNLSSDLQQNKATLASTEDAANKFDRSLDNVDESVEKVSGGFTVMKGALANLLADGIKAATGALEDFVLESGSAYSGFQAQTGASTEEMKKFKSEMNDLYKNNFGESLQDIGDKMAYVKQVTGEVDPSKIRELTENAITLEDTFGSDFNETIRGVTNLMNHFGIDAEEAFDLFAKGSQEGLDYTDELGDNIAEYGGNFEQAGYSAEEYFQLLANGTKNGAYNLDKVNDSINEVKNRLGDGTIEKALGSFSKDTQKAFKNWKDGKGTMKDVIDSIVGDINNCTNEQDALNMAATAFGTMGEDANLKVVKSLTSTGDAFKDVKGTMEDVKKVKYDDVKSQFAQLGRTLQLDVIAPLAEDALPAAKEFTTWTIQHLNDIIPIAATVGTAIAAIFAVNKTAQFLTSIKTLMTAMKALKIEVTAAAASSKILSAALTALPYVAVAAGIAAVVAGITIYQKKQEETIEKEYGLSKAQKETIENAKNLKAAYDQTNQARNDSMKNITTEYGYLNQLKGEYNSLIDSNGQVKKGYEDRANFILNELSQALGMEKEQILANVDANGKLGASIDQVIQKKQAEAMLSANEAAYTEAIQKRTSALSTYQSSLQTLEQAEKKYSKTKTEANEVMKVYEELLRSNPDAAVTYYNANKTLIESNEEAKKSYDKAKKGVKDAESAYVGYNTTIQNYEGLSSAIISGDSTKIQDALLNMQNNFITAENGTKQSLENQVKNLETNYENMKQAIANNTPGVTAEMVTQAGQMVEKAKAELDKLPPQASESGKKSGKAAADGLGSTSGDNETAGKNVAESQKKGLGSSDTKGTGSKKGVEFKEGLDSTNKPNLLAAKTLSENVNSGLGTANTNATGSKKGSEFGAGVSGQAGAAKTQGKNVASSANKGMGSVNASGSGKNLSNTFKAGVGRVATSGAGKGRANEAKSGMAAVSANSTGDNFTQGFVNGMSNGKAAGSIWSKAWNLGKKALSALSDAIKEGSPSKLTYKSGDFFVQGFANAIGDNAKLAINAAKELGKQSLEALNKELDTNVNMPTLKSNMQMTKNAVKNTPVVAQSAGNAPVNNTYNFYQTNNSPKSLSRLEIYRQTRNQLNFAKGVM